MKLLLLLLAPFFTGLWAQPSIQAVAVLSEEVSIDGRDFENFWKKCRPARGFTQSDPKPGALASDSTEVFVAYGPRALYIFARLNDPEPLKIVRQITRRDRWVGSDWFFADIDALHDHRNAYRFTVNAGGTERDGVIARDHQGEDDTWDGLWRSGVALDGRSWCVEMEIPFSTLRFSSKDTLVFGANFRRFHARRQEWSTWIPMGPELSGYVSRFNHLTGISGVDAVNPVVQLPYFSFKGIQEYGGESAGTPPGQLAYLLGADAQYAWRNGVGLNVAVNPDFGQVEADRSDLNLTAYETFYPEKRPFFLEGKKIFETPYQLFYSRRIGRSPSLEPTVPEGGKVTEKPANTTIFEAGKLTGKFDNGVQFGAVQAVTQEEEAVVADSSGVHSRSLVEPRAFYQVGRVQKDFFQNSSAGLLATAVRRSNDDHAYAGGADWNLGFAGGRYRVEGQGVASQTRDLGLGYGGQARFEKTAGEHVRWSLGTHYNAPSLDLNDLGYFNGRNRRGGFGNLTFLFRPDKGPVRAGSVSLQSGQGWNFDRLRVDNYYGLNGGVNLPGMGAVGGLNLELTRYDDAITGEGPPLGLRPDWEYWTWVWTDDAKPLSATFKLGIRPPNPNGNVEFYGVDLRIKPWTRLEFNADLSTKHSKRPTRYVTNAGDDVNRIDVVADLDQRLFDAVTRWTYLFTKTLSLQFYNQFFFARGDYGDFERLKGPFDYAPLLPGQYSDDPDFMKTSYGVNLLLRWEYLPGSTLYTVWTQSVDDSRLPSVKWLRQGWETWGSAPKNNAFLLKCNYRFVL